MAHKNYSVSFKFLVGLLAIYFLADSTNVSIVAADKILTQPPYSKVRSKETMMRTTIQDRSRRRRRSIKEQRDNGQEDVCADIIGPKWQMNKEGKSGPCPELVVWVPKTGFTEFIKVEDSKVRDGFSIAIFCHALQLLPFKVEPIFKAFVNDKGESNGTYNQLLEQIKGKKCHAVAADVVIRAKRAEFIDFTFSHMSSEVYMLVRASHEWNQTLWTFLRPFTWRLWITIVAACIYIGAAIAILEYRVDNPVFAGPFYQIPKMIIWFPISTFYFNEGKIVNRNSKVVLVLWLSTIFIIVQIFTATLSAWLTIDQMRPTLPPNYEKVGYHAGSYLKEYIMEKYNNAGVPLKSVEEYKNALTNGTVNVVFDDLPYIDLFLSKYGSEYMKFGPITQESGHAFAFPRGSPLHPFFSRAVLNVTESDTMTEMKKKYLGFRARDKSKPDRPLPRSLDVQSFIGLFVFMGIVTIVAIISSEISGWRVKKKILPISTDD